MADPPSSNGLVDDVLGVQNDVTQIMLTGITPLQLQAAQPSDTSQENAFNSVRVFFLF